MCTALHSLGSDPVPTGPAHTSKQLALQDMAHDITAKTIAADCWCLITSDRPSIAATHPAANGITPETSGDQPSL
jgi:hypothetical protein